MLATKQAPISKSHGYLFTVDVFRLNRNKTLNTIEIEL